MSSSSEDRANEAAPVPPDPGASPGSSSPGSSSGSGRTRSSSSSSDSRRVAPKWLGKKIGRFRLQGLLGRGAVGRVFRAEDSILHRRVALKIITLHGADGQINRNADQFLTEARAAAALEHPHVVQIYEAGESGNLCYIAMELLDGGSLRDLVVAAGPMDPGRACLLTADAAEALAAGHEAGIIHRDVKPANLMLSRQGRCKLTDFGLATFGDADSVSRERGAGTPLFAAPEVIRGTSADERSDIYSLGATLFYLLAGRPPFSAKTRAEVLEKHVNEPVPDLRVLRPGLPESLVAAVEKALDKDPGQRFASAQQFARVLRVQTIPVAAMPVVAAGPGASSPSSTVSGESIAGASVLNLSGLTAVSGSDGRLVGSAAGGQLTADDVASAGVRRPAEAGPAAVEHGSPSPPPATPFWHRPAGLAAVGLTGLVLLLLLAAVLFHSARPVATVTPPAIASPVPAASPGPPAASPAAPPSTTAPTRPNLAVKMTAAEVTPVLVTDLDHLLQIANGQDDARPHKRATVIGTVTAAAPGPNGKTIRLQFAGTPFVVVYFDKNGLYQQMADKFGGPNGTGLAGKTIRVTGLAKDYNGQPAIEALTARGIAVLADQPQPK